MGEVLRLVRFHNLLIAAAGVLAGGWIALARVALPPALGCAALAGMGLGAYGFIRNDVQDAAADRVSHPSRPIASGRVDPAVATRYGRWAALGGTVALVLAIAAGGPAPWLLACFGAAAAVMTGYSRGLKRRPLVGNLAVAVVAGLPLGFGAAAVGRPGDGLVPWALAAWIHLAREIVKDVEDEAGDRAVGRRTLAMTLGRPRAERLAAVTALGFIAASLVLPYRAHYGVGYFAVAVVAQLAVLVAAARLMAGRIERVSVLLKGAMVAGLAALVTGRVV